MPYWRMQAVAQDPQDPTLLDHAAILADLGRAACYLFTPTGTADTWDVPGTTALGEDSWLVASQPGDKNRQRAAGTWVQEAGVHDPLVNAYRLRAALLRTAEVHP
ncbi:hypothetical protein [Streptomyces sp. NBC_01207]|uniref:hypothetical protein n=1 Tax=Streptomyces sp. NBC_01207 TaxID=2903772 RepID=UPI002E0F243D|nr:hypothetical protein OG457_49710 [Streptomyces sp. NBC_01207]